MVALSIALAIWGIRVRGKPWWKVLGRPHPQLYLSTTLDRQPDERKTYMAFWSSTYLSPSFTTRVPWAATFEGAPPEERAFTLYIFNAGPEIVRHIRATWEMPGLDSCAAVQETGLFDGFIESVSPQHLSLQKETAGTTRPMASKTEVQYPILGVGETMQITAPEGFTVATTVAFLARAKMVLDQRKRAGEPGPGLAAALQWWRQIHRPMLPISICLRYTVGEYGESSQRFKIIGLLRAGSVLRAREGEENMWEPDPDGISATIDALRVVEL